MNNSYLINFITPSKRGFGHFHKRLMQTEYSSWLSNLKIEDGNRIYLEGQVITVVFSPKDLSPLSMKIMFEDLHQFCKNNKIGKVILPFQPLVVRGADIEILSVTASKILSREGLKVISG